MLAWQGTPKLCPVVMSGRAVSVAERRRELRCHYVSGPTCVLLYTPKFTLRSQHHFPTPRRASLVCAVAMAIARHASPFEPSPSPQPQLTKRDVRRNRIMEKLQGMINTFSANQHQHYRAQLQGVQVDMTLVLRADPYGADGPLGDSHDEIRGMVESVMKGDATGNQSVNLPDEEHARNDFWSIAGKRYSEFVREINDAVEQRDADLTALHVSWTSLCVGYAVV